MTEKETPADGAGPAAETPGLSRGRWLLALVIGALTLVTLRVPQEVLKGVIDDSWNAALVYAHVNHFKFGDDVVFTYGPLGYLVINHFMTDTAVPRLLLGLLMTGLTVTGLCVLAWRMKWPWRLAWAAVFLVSCGVLHWAGDDLFTELALLAWGMLCLLESGGRLKAALACLLLTALIAALIKFTLAVVACLALGTVACDLVLRNQKRLAAGVAGIFCAGWAAAWVLLGQDLARVGVFFRHWLQIAGGYNQAMSLDESNVVGGLLMIAAAVAAVVMRVATMNWPDAGRINLRKPLLVAWLSAQIFLAWKYGYVRSDQVHLALFLVMLPVMALLLEALPASAPRWQWAGRSAALACAALTMYMLSGFSHSFLAKSFEWSVSNTKDNLRAVFQADVYTQEKVRLQNIELAKLQLPEAGRIIGHETVDVFGQFAISAIFNGMNYHPRPVMQSYSAYSKPLMQLNEQFYVSTNAPEYLLFDLEAIDGRYPTVEDALALRAALGNYELVTNDNMFLVLHRARSDAAKLKLLREGDAAWGGRIELTNVAATNLWLELDAQPSLAGKAYAFLYKPPEVQMKVWWGTNAAPKDFRVPVSMLAAGFVASPVLLSTADVQKFYLGQELPRSTAISLNCDDVGAWPWQAKVHYRVYEIEKRQK